MPTHTVVDPENPDYIKYPKLKPYTVGETGYTEFKVASFRKY